MQLPSQVVPGALVAAHLKKTLRGKTGLAADDLFGEAARLFDDVEALVPCGIVAHVLLKQALDELEFAVKELEGF